MTGNAFLIKQLAVDDFEKFWLHEEMKYYKETLCIYKKDKQFLHETWILNCVFILWTLV